MSRRSTIVNGQFLLDQFSGAAAAYSLRRLRNAYTGSCIRVRRSSDNAELDIGFTSTGVLDTAALLAHVGAGNGFVTTWYDQSGNARNLTQATAGNQPRIVISGVLQTLNSKPIIPFNGTSDFLATAASVISTDFGIFGVGNTPTGATNGVLLTQYNVFDTARTLFYMGNNVNRITAVQIGTASSKTGTITNAQKMFYFNRAGSDIEYADDGTALTNFTNGTVCQNAPLRMGFFPATNFLQQNIQECIVYTFSQSANRTAIENNIMKYYGI
jgi:hypothetical protein